MTTRVLLVPGLAVRAYLEPAAAALRARGLAAELLAAPGSPEAPADLTAYGRALGAELPAGALLVGQSVGGQAAAIAAARDPGRRLAGLVLVSPTVDVTARSAPRLLGRWARAGRGEPAGLLAVQAPEWRAAGVRRIRRTLRSSLRTSLELSLPAVRCPVVVVRGEDDKVTSFGYATALATGPGRRLVVVPGATHSWPFGDEERFADVVQGLADDMLQGTLA